MHIASYAENVVSKLFWQLEILVNFGA